MKKLLLSLLALCSLTVYADTMTEGFEDVTVVDAEGNAVSSNYTFGAGLSNGWVVVGGNICIASDYADFGLWSTANSGSKSLTAQYGSTNNGVIVIPQQLTGTFTFYARKTSSSSSTKGYVDLFEMEKDGNTYKKVDSKSFQYWTLTTTTWTKYEIDLGNTPRYIGISLIRAGFDDVVFNTVSTDPHEHSYANAWSSDATGHWHACTSETGYCDTPKADFAAHDGAICSICGYKTPGVETYPWKEDFEALTSGIPAGWDNSEGTTTSASYKWNFYNGYSDGKHVRFNSYYNGEGNTNVLATPLFYIPADGTYELKFKCKNPAGGQYEVKVAEYGSEEREVLFDNLTGIAAWTEKAVTLEKYAGKAIRFYFCGTSNYNSGDAYLYLDDVIVRENIAHVHDYATAWSHDVRNHWHACLSTVGECDAEKIDVEAHSFDENDVCTVCGYDKPFIEDFENGISALWTNNGWTVENNPANGNGTKMAFAGRYTDGTTLTTPRLKANAGDVMELEALLPWSDETLTMEYSTDNGETWTVAFAETPANDKTLSTLTWTAPADGIYMLRFSGKFNYIDNVCGFKLAPTELEESELQINRWATLCYPADVNLEGDVKAYIISNVTEDGIEVAEVQTVIPASKPVLLYSANDESLFLPAASHTISTAAPVKEDNNLLLGCYVETTMDKSSQYTLTTQNDEPAFYRVNTSASTKVAPYECYLEVEGSTADKFSIVDNDIITGITNILGTADTTIYDLSGRKVKNMVKGNVYIIGNKKIIVR